VGRVRKFIGLAAACAALTGCGGSPGASTGSTADPAASTNSGGPAMRELQSFEQFSGYMADYEPYTSLEQMAAESELVVRGELRAVRKGRIVGAETMASAEAAQALTIEVVVDVVSKGSQRLIGESLYVELPSGGRDVTAFSAMSPGTEAVFYLVPAPMEVEGGFTYGEDQQGRPIGAALWKPIGPQGFIIGGPEGSVQVLDVEEVPGSTLAEFLP